ncbi:hypothetical protein I3843_09G138600 [Carya illinoinensis]|nr:hypothetical protein I3760_09G139900 [Carya illinoinensis]KAG7963873.1 hypothetical protein I3843_09G138600 [Carya illinoinensis]
MPLPWKKHRRTRISRIVADLQSPPKHGGSLVVETGFPTSLIDLFVKNRDRLKKKSLKINRNKNPVPIQPSPSDESTSPTSVTDDSTLSGSPSFGVDSDPAPWNEIEEEDHRSKDEGTECPRENHRDQSRAVFAVVMVVLVLAVSTKRLALGVTMSAFLLIFAEYVCIRSIRFLKLCASAKAALESFLQRVTQLVWIEKFVLLLKNIISSKVCLDREEETIVAKEITGNELNLKNPRVPETQIAGTDCITNEEEIVIVGPELEFLSRDKRWGCLDEENKVEEHMEDGPVLVCGNQRSRSARLKSKLVKKLVPKKLRNLKKNRKSKGKNDGESSSEVSSTLGDDVSARFVEPDEQEIGNEQFQESDDRSSLSLLQEEKCEEEQVVDDGNPRINEQSRDKGAGRDREGNLGYVTLLVIALAGLAGGRVVALVVTISWCFMMKLTRSRSRSVNVPL